MTNNDHSVFFDYKYRAEQYCQRAAIVLKKWRMFYFFLCYDHNWRWACV